MSRSRPLSSGSPASEESPSVAARMDRLPVLRSHKLITIVIGLGVFFDQYENFLAPIMSTVLKKHFELGGTQLSLVLASAFLGQFVGALWMGRLADRIGRQHTFIINLLVYSLASIVCGLAPHASVLILARFVAGIGIGGVGGLIVWAIRSFLPESPVWLEAHGRTDEAEKIARRFEDEARKEGHTLAEPDTRVRPAHQKNVQFSEVFAPAVRKRTLVVSIMSVLQVFGYYGFGTIATLALAAKGFDVVDSIAYTAVTYIGYPVGSLLMVPLVDRFERKHLIVATAIMMGVFGLVFGFSPTPAIVMIAGGLFTASSNMFSGVYHTYLAENFPTRIRGTAAGFAYSLSKISAGVMPFILLPILHSAGPGRVFTVVAVAMVIMMIDIGVFGVRTTGRNADIEDHL